MSDHYIVKIPKKCSGARYDSIKSLKCEIQVRTISMHAWGTVSHHLDYKQDVDIPSNLKKDFYALSGIFYVADSLFEQFRMARNTTLKPVVESAKKYEFDLATELNLDTLPTYLIWKLPDREQSSSRLHSILLRELNIAKIRSYAELDALINDNMAWFIQREIEYPPSFEKMVDNKKVLIKLRFVDIGVIRVMLRERLKLIP